MDYIGIDVFKKESEIDTLAGGEIIEASADSEWVARCLETLGHEGIVADPKFAPMYATQTRKVKASRDARALAEATAFRGPWTSGKPGPIPRFPLHSHVDSREFPRIAVSGSALEQAEIDSAIQATSASKVRRVDFGDCGPRSECTKWSSRAPAKKGIRSRGLVPQSGCRVTFRSLPESDHHL